MSEAHYAGLLSDHPWMESAMAWTAVEKLHQNDVLTVLGRSVEELVEEPLGADEGRMCLIPDEEWLYLVEDDGLRGASPDIVAPLSRAGLAVAVFWNASAASSLIVAEIGTVVFSAEILFPDEAVGELPVDLRPAWVELREVVAREDETWRIAALDFVEAATGRKLWASWFTESWPALDSPKADYKY